MSDEQLAGRARELENEWQQLHEQVIAAGGLHIIGTERHESRRIDNQLRGRSGRQGDPGSSRFYLSLEDNLMRIFGDPERTKSLLKKVGMQEGEAIESGMLTHQIEKRAAQGRVAQLRRAQEPARVRRRRERPAQGDLPPAHRDHVHRRHRRRDQGRARGSGAGNSSRSTSRRTASRNSGTSPGSRRPSSATSACTPASRPGSRRTRRATARRPPRACSRRSRPPTKKRSRQVGAPVMRHLERAVMLQQLDMHWREHLAGMDYLRQGIYLRAYAQKNPKQEYKREAFALFTAMLDRIRSRHGDAAAAPAGAHRGRDRARGSRAPAPAAEPHAAPARGAAGTRRPGARRRGRGGPAASGVAPRPRIAAARLSCAASARSAATNPVPAAPAASSSTATGRCSGPAARQAARNGRTKDGESGRNSCHCRRHRATGRAES